jgi:hypothetical protein
MSTARLYHFRNLGIFERISGNIKVNINGTIAKKKNNKTGKEPILIAQHCQKQINPNTDRLLI